MASQSPEISAQSSVRQTVSFPRSQHELLQLVAKEKKVSVSWVIRDAVEAYLAEKWPLLKIED